MTDLPGAADVADLLHRWMPGQRWYPAKGRGVGLRDLGSYSWGSEDGVDVVVHVLGLDSGDRLDVVQVPLTLRTAPLDGADAALIGSMDDRGRRRWVYDAPNDPAYVAALLRALSLADGSVPVPPGSPSRVLRGEQSNTSIIVEPASGAPVIVKVFRTLHPGANPDVEVLAGLTRVGCPHVPQLRGWLTGSWAAPGPDDTAGSAVSGHLAVAVEFLPGSEDAWRVALAAVGSGTPFTAQAHGLGAATARVHQDLAVAFGTTELDPTGRDRLVAGLQQRVTWARSAVRQLDESGAALQAHLETLAGLPPLPALQRVHGDLHLGQVLQTPGHGWVMLDFEGEPLRPLSERTVPDLALRDVAGMLHSIDYAAGHDEVMGAVPGGGSSGEGSGGEGPRGEPSGAERSGGSWAAAARDAYCTGYSSVAGQDPRDAGGLLRVLELDKALYQTVYEAQNRPRWLPVSLRAVSRLLA